MPTPPISAQLGEPTNDVARLVAYEINKADDSSALDALGDNVDAAMPTPGSLSLSFERWFQPGVSARYQNGHPGPGLDGQLGHHRQHRQQRQRHHQYKRHAALLQPAERRQLPRATFGDNGVLTKLSGGGYQLTETNGSSTVFNANGTLNYVQDSNGNRITATYNAAAC